MRQHVICGADITCAHAAGCRPARFLCACRLIVKLRDVGEAATDHVTREGRLPVNLPVACGPGVVCAWGGGAPLPRRMARRWRWVSWLHETKRETQKTTKNSQLFPCDEKCSGNYGDLNGFGGFLGPAQRGRTRRACQASARALTAPPGLLGLPCPAPGTAQACQACAGAARNPSGLLGLPSPAPERTGLARPLCGASLGCPPAVAPMKKTVSKHAGT